MHRRVLIFVLLCCVPLFSDAQQIPTLSLFSDNFFILNPAAAGISGNANITGVVREQWAGYDLSPRTYWISGEYRRLKRRYQIRQSLLGSKIFRPQRKDSNVGVGAAIYTDRSGLLHNTGINLSYAYHIFLQNTQLSMGISAVTNQLHINKNNATVIDQNDPILERISTNLYTQDFQLGLFLKSRTLQAGLSSVNILNSGLRMGNSTINYKNFRHYLVSASLPIDLDKDVTLNTHVLLRVSNILNYQFELSTRFSFSRKYIAGIHYRSNGDLVVLTGFKLADNIMFQNLFIGYAFDYPFFNKLHYNNLGSHEVLLRYTMGTDDRRVRWKDRY